VKTADLKRRERLVGLLLSAILVVSAIAPAATAVALAEGGSAATTSAKHGKHAKKKKQKSKKAKKKKAKKRKKTKTAQSAKPSAAACAATPSAMDAASAAFLAHVRSAHLEKSVGEKSPLEQVADLGNLDAYVKLHTIWLETVLAPFLKSSDCPSPPAGAPGGGSQPESEAVMITDYKYSPAKITVPAGSKVTWMNHDADAHTITSKSGGPLSSSNLAKGGTFAYTFSTPGTYDHHCAIHPQMTGTVTVQ
jgi:plastocyanin/uncharacterized membrane protein